MTKNRRASPGITSKSLLIPFFAEEQSSFLKKRSKKLLLLGAAV
jgi:hypothetical protein